MPLLGGLGGDRRVLRLELLILPDEFADDRHRRPGDFEVALSASDFKGSDECVGGGGVEVERQYLIHGWMLVCGSGNQRRHPLGYQRRDCFNPREREALRGQRRIDLRLDLCVQIGVDAGNTVRTEVILHPADDDVIGEVGVRNERDERVQRGLLDAADVGGVALAVVSDDGVEHGGDDIGLPLVLGITDEVGGGPSVGVCHKWFG